MYFLSHQRKVDFKHFGSFSTVVCDVCVLFLHFYFCSCKYKRTIIQESVYENNDTRTYGADWNKDEDAEIVQDMSDTSKTSQPVTKK